MKNPNISPNQFAFEGMEHHAHPLAEHLREGIYFHRSDSPGSTARGDMDDPRGPSYRVPLSFSPPVTEHSFVAVSPRVPERPNETAIDNVPGRLAGELHWRGDKTSTKNYPGEITYVGRGVHRTEDLYRTVGNWASHNPFPRTPGMMTNMFRFTHEHVQPGQKTVPVHSPERTAEGERWAQSVGDYGTGMPERYDEGWRPEKGVHPYEAAAKAEKKAAKKARPKKIKGQKKLF